MKAIVEQIDGVALKHLESMELVFMDFAYKLWIARMCILGGFCI